MDAAHEHAIEQIHDIRRRMEAAENTGNTEFIASVFADDAVLMVPTFPVQEGATACGDFIRGLLPGLLAHFDRRITYTSAEVRIIGDLAVDRGEFAFTTTPRDGGTTNRETGKYLWQYARTRDGLWKLSRAIVSLDEPDREDVPAADRDAPTWRARAGSVARQLALPFAIVLGAGEVVRNWGDWGFWPFWVVDYLAVALLLAGWRASGQGWPQAPALVAGAWGFTSAMFYMSFFGHLASIDAPDRGPVSHVALTAVIGCLFAVTVVTFASSLVAPPFSTAQRHR